jgi:uncharacterized BrkB/YihY/UPF0761 family membrane protein
VLRERVAIVDIGARVYERDKQAGGTLLGSALALRLFLFFVPFILLIVGLAGVLGKSSDGSAVAESAGLGGTLANYVDDAFAQSGNTPWIALVVGLFGIATTGWSLTRALVLSSALSWRMGGKQFYLPYQVTSSSELYGQLGVLIAFLGWFFFLGRTIAFAFALNAVIYEQVGSLSTLFFALPVIRQLPRKVPAVERYFALDHVAAGEPEPAGPSGLPGVDRP